MTFLLCRLLLYPPAAALPSMHPIPEPAQYPQHTLNSPSFLYFIHKLLPTHSHEHTHNSPSSHPVYLAHSTYLCQLPLVYSSTSHRTTISHTTPPNSCPLRFSPITPPIPHPPSTSTSLFPYTLQATPPTSCPLRSPATHLPRQLLPPYSSISHIPPLPLPSL